MENQICERERYWCSWGPQISLKMYLRNYKDENVQRFALSAIRGELLERERDRGKGEEKRERE